MYQADHEMHNSAAENQYTYFEEAQRSKPRTINDEQQIWYIDMYQSDHEMHNSAAEYQYTYFNEPPRSKPRTINDEQLI